MEPLDAYLARVEGAVRCLSRQRRKEALRDIRCDLLDAADRQQVETPADWERFLATLESPEVLGQALCRLNQEAFSHQVVQHVVTGGALFLGFTAFFSLHSVRCAESDLLSALGAGVFLGAGLTWARSAWRRASVKFRIAIAALAGSLAGLVWSLAIVRHVSPGFLLMGFFVGLAAELALSRVAPWKTLPAALLMAIGHMGAMAMVSGWISLRASLLVFALAVILQAFLGLAVWLQDQVMERWALR